MNNGQLKAVYKMSKLLTALLSVFMLGLTYLLLRPYNIIEVDSHMGVFDGEEFEYHYSVLNENKTVVKGKELYYSTSHTKHKSFSAQLFRSIICAGGGYETLAPTKTKPQDSNIPTGKHVNNTLSVAIPENAPTGECYYNVLVEYKVNFLRIVSYEFRSEPFYIVNGN